MGLTNIATSSLFQQGVNNILSSQNLISKLQNEVSTGKKINNPSDDPVGDEQLLRLNLENAQYTNYTNNINAALAETSTTDTTLSSVVSLAQNAQNVAIQASNSTQSSSDLTTLATSVDNMIQQMTGLANTQYQGRYIFGGLKTDTAPYTATGDTIAYSGSDPAKAYQRTVQTGPNTSVAYNLNGKTVFGSTDNTGPTLTGSGLLYDMTKLKQDLQTAAATSNPDLSDITSDIAALNTDKESVTQQQSALGDTTNSLQLTLNRLSSQQLNQQSAISAIQSANLPQAISDLNLQQNIYSASLNVFQQIESTSLINFLGTSSG